MAVLGVSAMAVFGTLHACNNAVHHMRMQTHAALLAERQMVETFLEGRRSFTTWTGAEGRFTWQVQVAPTPVEQLGSVTVTVHWTERQSGHSFSLVSYMQMQTFSQGQ
jgi:hypothetical protein